MAAMCVELRMTPAEYWALTLEEHAALIAELNDRARQQRQQAKGR